MAAVDMARNSRYYTDTDIDAAPAESPARERIGPGDHLGPQFAETYTSSGEATPARRANYIAGQTVHQWRTGGRDDHDTKGSNS
jgi:hypothetical protein